MSTETVSREAQIIYITEWAARYGATLQLAGECGFGRECVGILKGDTYIDYEDCPEIWTPEDAYHKHDCMAVLGRGDEALAQLHEWVKWVSEHGYGIEVIARRPTSDIDLLFHGISLPRLVQLPAAGEIQPGSGHPQPHPAPATDLVDGVPETGHRGGCQPDLSPGGLAGQLDPCAGRPDLLEISRDALQA